MKQLNDTCRVLIESKVCERVGESFLERVVLESAGRGRYGGEKVSCTWGTVVGQAEA